MNLVDAGPLIALIDRGQEAHDRCVKALKTLSGALLTTWPCFTEAMYFLYELRRWSGQKALWDFRERDLLFLHTTSSQEADRMQTLMARYQNVPMDLADASLVAAAEFTGLQLIFTLDSDFRIY